MLQKRLRCAPTQNVLFFSFAPLPPSALGFKEKTTSLAVDHQSTVVCACGATFETGTTKDTDLIKVEICNKCHPYFTGKQKLVDAGGRVDKFKKRYGMQ